MLKKEIKELFKHRELLVNIALRSIKARYKQSVLGISWAVVRPLSMMLMFTVIFSKFAKIPSDGIPYPIFSYCALLPWTFFSASLISAIPSLVANASIVTKIYCPREIFPIASILAAIVDFSIAAVIFAVMLIAYKIHLTFFVFYAIPILLIQIIFTIAIALFASAFNVYYRDTSYAFPLFIQLWMYATPIIYPVSIVPAKFKFLYMLNPMAPIIDGYRRVLLQGLAPDFPYLGISLVISCVLFMCSFKYFKRVEMVMADII